jgi:NOL1/NOP2/fmu family ribosome biogenesis protein
MQVIKSNEKKEILSQLNEQYGISSLPHLLLRFGKEKIRAFSGNLSADELRTLDKYLRIETAGIYIAKQHPEGVRLTIDGVSLLKNQVTKNILEIDDKEAEEWFKGNDLMIEHERAFKILKNDGELVGCGKSTGEKITNFMPKERRVRG